MENCRRTDSETVLPACLKCMQDGAWLLLVLLTPLLLNLWGQQPFELPKVMVMRTLVWLLAGLALAEHLLTGRSLRRTGQANPLLWPVGVLVLVLVVTTATAVNWRLSLWGSSDRSQGAVTLLTYLLLFLLAVDQFRRPFSRTWQIITAMVVASIPLILLGLLQAFGWNLPGLVSDARSLVFATLGRANFLGAYLAMLGPLTLALLLTTRQRRWRVVLSVLFGGQLVVIGLTLARGTWLATAVSLALFVLLWWEPQLTRLWRRLAWSGLGLLFLSGPLAVWWQGQGQAGSTAARLAIWQGTTTLIGQRPLLGYGADSLGIMFPRVYPPELVYYQGRDFFVDRAHNLFLDWTVTAGVPGLLAFCLVLLIFVTSVGRALRQPQPAPQRALLIAVLAAVLGNVANNLVSFEVTPTATASWLLLGMGVALAAPPAVQDPPLEKPQTFWSWVQVGFIFIGIGVAVWQLNGRPLMADVAARSAHQFAQKDNLLNAIAAGERAVALWPVEPAHHLLLGSVYWQQAVANPVTAQTQLAQAEAELLAARQLQPEDPTIWLHTAQFYTAVARQFGGETRPLADAAYGQAVSLAPNQAAIYTDWGRVYLAEGDVAAAAPLLRQAVRLDASSGEAYLYLGAAELALGRLEVALADYQEAVRLLPDSSEAYAGLADGYWQLDRPQEARWAVAEALQRNPHNAQAVALRQLMGERP